ncbi:MAG: biopolymer transporter ExbD [Deltaproteobacteria bacterium]|nr:biopolymer transporter ExbD [Deltaproteobacteria bacterium]
MAFATGPHKGLRADINVTPLVDVVLVLLIIFMVVTPMLQRGKEVRLPAAARIDQEGKQADPLVLSVTADGRTWIESTSYAPGTLRERLQVEIRANPGRKLLLKGDERLTFGQVREVMDLARRAGARGIALAVQELKK